MDWKDFSHPPDSHSRRSQGTSIYTNWSKRIKNKVLYVVHGKGYGGGESFLEQLVLNLDKYTPTMAGPAGILAKRLVSKQIRWHEIPELVMVKRNRSPLWPIRFAKAMSASTSALFKIIDSVKPAIVHANGFRAAVYAFAAAKERGIPMIWTHHDISRKSARENLLLKGLSAGKAHCVCVSNAVRKNILDYGYSATRCSTIPNGIDLDEWDPGKHSKAAARSKFGLDESLPVLASISRFEKWKGFDVVVDCVKLLKEKIGSKFVWLLGSLDSGTKSYEEEIKHRIQELSLSDVIRYVEFMPHEQMPGVIAAVDIFVHLPVEPEPLGIVILEAMAMKKIVVAAGHGGITDIITDGVDGFLVKPSDAEGTVAKILDLLESRNRFPEIGKAARKKVSEKFDARIVAAEYENLYSRLIR